MVLTPPGTPLGSGRVGWQAVANEAFQVRYGDRFFLSSLKESAEKKEIPALASSFVIQCDSLEKDFDLATGNRRQE